MHATNFVLNVGKLALKLLLYALYMTQINLLCVFAFPWKWLLIFTIDVPATVVIQKILLPLFYYWILLEFIIGFNLYYFSVRFV
jgi:hypothetical protein